MGSRIAGKPPLAMALTDVLQEPHGRLKNRVAQAQLVVVHDLRIDEAGESGFGVRLFAEVLREVLVAREQLEKAGVTHFLFTSDHGFLLQRGLRTHGFGQRGQADRRYVFSEEARGDGGHLSMPLSALEYDGAGFLVFREDTAQYDVGRPAGTFTHGGNSLQERVIPVLHLHRKRQSAETGVRYSLAWETQAPLNGAQRLRVRVTPVRGDGQAPLEFASAQPVELFIRVPGRDDVKVVVKDITGPDAQVLETGVRLRSGSRDWNEVFFVLEGPTDDPQPIELSLPAQPEERWTPLCTYPVSHVGPQRKEATPRPEPEVVPAKDGWAERLKDPDAGKVFDHLQRFGSLNEAELVQLLGSPRKARAFAAKFDAFKGMITFHVQVVMTADGKRYQKL
jgi:hypothetical protein